MRYYLDGLFLLRSLKGAAAQVLLISGLALFALSCGGSDAENSIPMFAEAGFIEIEPVTFTLRYEGDERERTSSLARIWYAFQPADEDPAKKPLIVFFNGGPGSSTSLLFGWNTGKMTVDPAFTGGRAFSENPNSWTKLGNLLYIDARQTGFSYCVIQDADKKENRVKEFSSRNFNSLLDGADFVRVVLRFLKNHAQIQGNKVIIAGESYGGIRSTVMLNLLLRYKEYGDGSLIYQDAALADEIQRHFDAVFPKLAGQKVPPEEIIKQWGAQILIQPLLTGKYQDEVSGEMLETQGSVVYDVAAQTGKSYQPCDKADKTCNPYNNAIFFVNDAAGRDLYNCSKPAGWMDDEGMIADNQLVQSAALQSLLGFDPAFIQPLYAKNRTGAYRFVSERKDEEQPALDALPTFAQIMLRRYAKLKTMAVPAIKGDLRSIFGELPAWDEYYLSMHYNITAAFYASDALAMPIDPQSPIYGEMFLYNLTKVRTFITNSAFDLVIFSPAIPAALAKHSNLVDSVVHETTAANGEERPGLVKVKFAEGAFGLSGLGEKTFRFPRYTASGHPVECTEPAEFLKDVESWLKEK